MTWQPENKESKYPNRMQPIPSLAAPHLYEDGSQAAHDAGTQAPVPSSQAHPRAFQALRTSKQGYPWPCLHVKFKHNLIPSQSSHRMQPILLLAALAYVRIRWSAGSTRRQNEPAFIGCFLSDEMRLRRLCVAVEIGTGFRFGFRRLLTLESTWDEMCSF